MVSTQPAGAPQSAPVGLNAPASGAAARLQPPSVSASLSMAAPKPAAPGTPPPGSQAQGSQPPLSSQQQGGPPPQPTAGQAQGAQAQGTQVQGTQAPGPQNQGPQNQGPQSQNQTLPPTGDLRGGDPGMDTRRMEALTRISSTSRTDWIVGDQTLTNSAKATGDEKLARLVTDVVSLLGPVRQATGRFEPQPFGGKPAVIVPSLLSYQPTVGATGAATRSLGQAIEKSPALFGDLGF